MTPSYHVSMCFLACSLLVRQTALSLDCAPAHKYEAASAEGVEERQWDKMGRESRFLPLTGLLVAEFRFKIPSSYPWNGTKWDKMGLTWEILVPTVQ